MKAFRKSDHKEIEVSMYYVKNAFAGYIEIQANGIRRFYLPTSLTIKEYYGG